MMEESLDALSSRLEALEAGDGARFDLPGCRCVRALLERAESLGSERLLSRAEARLERLEQRLAAARETTEEAIDELTAQRAPATAELREALRRGDVLRARRGVRRIRALPPLVRSAGDDAAFDRYRRAAAEFSAAVTIARARASVPAGAGPYNSTLVATHTLDRLAATSPTYLRTLVERLEDLAALQVLVPPPEPPAKPARKRGAASGGKAKGKPKAKPKAKLAAPGRRKSARPG